MAASKSEGSHLEFEARDESPLGFEPESRWAKYIPGGYSRSRCLKLSGQPMVAAILVLAGVSIMFFGYDASVMSLINVNSDYLRLMGTNSGSDRDAAAVGGLVSVWFIGFGIGALLVGSYADKIGRLKTLEVGCLWGLLGAVLQCSAQNFTWMIFARIIGGIGCGHLNTIIPVWTSELAAAHLRGAFVAVEFTLALSASTIVYWMEYALAKTASPAFAWRFPLGFQIIFLLFLLAAAPFYPESPRYLAKIGDMEGALEVLTQCRGRGQEGAEKAKEELGDIQNAIRLEAKSATHTYYSMLFCKDDLNTRRRILLGGGVQVMQKFTGIDFIAAYAPSMFALAGFGGDKPALLAGGNLISYTASLAIAIYLCDRFGRRRLMWIGCVLMGAVLIAGGVLSNKVQHATSQTEKERLGVGVTTVLYIYTFTYGSTWLTTCWVYPTEIFPLASRAKGAALSTVAFSLAGGLINEIVPYLINAVGFWIFIIFALINLFMIIPIWLFYPETARIPLEDLDMLFASQSPLVWRAEREFAEHKTNRTAERAELGIIA